MNKDQLVKANEMQKQIAQKENEVKVATEAYNAYKEGGKADKGEIRYVYKTPCGTYAFKCDTVNVEKVLKAELDLAKKQLADLNKAFEKI